MTDLDRLRAQIDDIDDRLHDLFMERFLVTSQVAIAKSAENDPTLIPRPAREQAILERLCARHSGEMPLRSLIRIWKEVVGAGCAQQGDFRVGVAADPISVLSFAAREHFGTAVPLEFGSRERVVAQLKARQIALAVLPQAGTLAEGLYAIGTVAGEGGETFGKLVSIHNQDW